jgi:uncharacterized protein (TIGR02284 family)
MRVALQVDGARAAVTFLRTLRRLVATGARHCSAPYVPLKFHGRFTTMSDNVTSVLNDLVETSRDGEQGFRTAAEDTKNAELRTVFLARAEDCAKAVADLRQVISRLGGEPQERGSIAGAVHRGWVNLKAAAAGRTDLSILEECERGEDVAKARYRKALEAQLPDDIRTIVQKQYDGVQRNHDQVRDLRDRYRANAA